MNHIRIFWFLKLNKRLALSFVPRYDNAAMENFFGTLKTECLYRRKFSCRVEVERAVTEYVEFYNYERIDLKNGLTPIEIRSKAV